MDKEEFNTTIVSINNHDEADTCLQQTATHNQDLVCANPAMLQVCQKMEKLADTNISVLFSGESGTGKEVFARKLHWASQRKNKAFIAINCAAIPEQLLESELFGYEKGAFTGASKQTLGKIENADGGTLFLDEIGDLSKALQAKLLRFLQFRVFERLGSSKETHVDVRIISATHKNLREMVKAGIFREDLYYRLAEVVIDIPPLRQRGKDTVLIAQTYLRRFCTEQGFNQNVQFTEDALLAIQNYTWPGNVRELENCIKRAVIMADSPQITVKDLELETLLREQCKDIFNLRRVRDAAECNAIKQVLLLHNGNISRIADCLGVSRPTVYYLMEKHNLKLDKSANKKLH